MKLTYEPLGKYVRLVDERNVNMVTETVLGINIEKYFMPSVANVIGTDLSNYKLLRNGRFACNPMHVGRDGRLPVARYTDDMPAIVSPAYFMFEIIDETIIEPNYLMLCFRRSDFDRMCWFRTDASVRGGITWEDVCALTIPVPSIDEQRKIVHDYQVIEDRIKLLRSFNDNLYAYLNSQFESLVADASAFVPLSSVCDYVDDKSDFGSLIEQNYLSTENFLQNKQGISCFGEIEDDVRVTSFQVGDTLISNIRPYFKKIWFATVSGGCNADVLCFRAHHPEDACFLNAVLYQDKFFAYVMSGAKGTKMPRGDKGHIMQYSVPVLSQDKREVFFKLARTIQTLQATNKKEIDVLQKILMLFICSIAKGV